MKVLIYSHAYPNPVEPTRSAFVREIVKHLSMNLTVIVVAPVPYFLNWQRNKPDTNVPYYRQDSFGERKVDVYHPRYLLLPKAYLRPILAHLQAFTTFLCLRRIHKAQKLDLVHANWGFPDGIAAGLICRRLGIPYIITEHQGSIFRMLHNSYYRKLLTTAYNQAAKVIVVSQSLKHIMEKTPGLRQDLLVIPNGIDLSLMRLRDKSPVLSKLVYIGYLIHDKGIQHLLKALVLSADQGLTLSLDIIGNGDYEHVLKRMVSELGLSDRVRFLGLYTAQQVRKKLPEYDLLVLPSLMESFGLVLIEAMASGLPVLSTLSGGPESIVTDATGILVKPGSDETLAQGLTLINERWSAYEPTQIRAYCQEHFAIENTCTQLTEDIAKVAGKHV